jgi:O-antigen ligase
MLIWLLIFSLFFIILALTHLDWAVLLIVATLPTYLVRFHVFGLPTTLLEIMILISFLVWFFKFFLPKLKGLLKTKKNRLNYPFYRELILLLIISWIAVGIAGFSLSSLGIWKAYFLEPLLLFILIFNVFKSKKDLFKILWALLISAIVISLFAIFQKITGLFISNPFWANAVNRRVISFFGYPNAVGLYLAPLILLFTGWLFSFSWKNIQKQIIFKSLIFFTIIISLLSVCAARSEGALIGIIVGLFVFCFLAGKKQLIIASSLLLVIIGGIFLFTPNNNSILKKLTLRDLSGQIRLQEWKETLMMLKDGKIVTGVGLNNYQKAVSPYHQAGIFFNYDNLSDFNSRLYGSASLRAKYWQPVEIYMYPHNIFLNFWSELGLVGLLLFSWLIAKYLIISYQLSIALKKENKKERYLVLGLLTAMVVILIHGLVDVPYFKNDLAIMFWILFALLGALNLNYQSTKKIESR